MIDMVPKAISLTLVSHSKENLQRELLQELYKPEVLDDLLKESEYVVNRRKEVVSMIQALNKAEECVFHLDPSLFVMIAAADANHLCCARFCSCNFLGSWRACKGCGCGMQLGGFGAFLLHMRTLQYPPVYIRSTYCRCCFLAEDKQSGGCLQDRLHNRGDTIGHTALGTSIHI